jgi:hypothetical protein
MKTELPAPEEYYRLTRARALRQRSERWEWWSRHGLTVLVAALPFALAGGAAVLLFGAWIPWLFVLVLLGMLLLACAVLVCFWEEPAQWLRARAAGVCEEAVSLEAEHQARYGAQRSRKAADVLEAEHEARR